MTATARIIVTGKNRDLFPSPYVVCRECGGSGNDYAYPINPSARPVRVDCPECNGDGVVLRKRTEPVAVAGRLPVATVALPDESMRPGRASIYDAAEERWIEKASGMTPDAVAATVSRQQTAQTTLNPVSRVEFSEAPGDDPCPPKSSPGDLLDKLQEVATFISAVIVFGGLAFICLVLA